MRDRARAPVAIVACGAVGAVVRRIAERRGWDADLHPLRFENHRYPDRLLRDLELKLAELQGSYRRTVVVYGDCGTGGRLDAVLERYGARRPPGNHCYDFLGYREVQAALAEQPGTYFLTPFMVRTFGKTVFGTLGLDRYPELRDDYFRNYTRVVYLADDPPDPPVEVARECAAQLGLPLEVRRAALETFESRLAALVEEEEDPIVTSTPEV